MNDLPPFDRPESRVDDRPAVQELFANLKHALPRLEKLFDQTNQHWVYEDKIYRFYHQSFKVFWVQENTLAIVAELQQLAPARELHGWFREIIDSGTGKTFTVADNKNWLPVTRPILEAFFHARFFLEMSVKYGRELEYPPRLLPSGWAALLYLYRLR